MQLRILDLLDFTGKDKIGKVNKKDERKASNLTNLWQMLLRNCKQKKIYLNRSDNTISIDYILY